MKVLIFGATGLTGQLLTRRCISEGHEVTAFARDPAHLTIQGLRVMQGDVLEAAAVDRAVAGQQAVLSALGTASRGLPPVLPIGIRHILDAMERHGVRRIVVLSAAGALHEPAGSAFGGLGLALARAAIPGVSAGYAEQKRTISSSSGSYRQGWRNHGKWHWPHGSSSRGASLGRMRRLRRGVSRIRSDRRSQPVMPPSGSVAMFGRPTGTPGLKGRSTCGASP